MPSCATAIGSSGDRPAALAELMGIIALPVSLLRLLSPAINARLTDDPSAPASQRDTILSSAARVSSAAVAADGSRKVQL